MFCYLKFGRRNLQTVESAQNRGLATLMIQIYSKEYAKRENLDILAFYHADSEVSAKIFSSLGYEEVMQCSWIKLKRI